MVKKLSIRYSAVTEPITTLVTKFGGQPVWLMEPQWPISRLAARPMEFIGQIALDPAFVGDIAAQMAYVFMTGDEAALDAMPNAPFGKYPETWNPDAGENAVILQPGVTELPTLPLLDGPSVRTQGLGRGEWLSQEYAVELTPGDDPSYTPEEERRTWKKDWQSAYFETVCTDKIGGTPYWWEGDAAPFGVDALLLLHLTQPPFWVNFGHAGIGMAFLRKDGVVAKFLWQ